MKTMRLALLLVALVTGSALLYSQQGKQRNPPDDITYLKQRITALQTQVNSLESRLEALEQQFQPRIVPVQKQQ